MNRSFPVIVGFLAAMVLAASAHAASLMLTPSDLNIEEGKTFPVSVLLDTQGTAIDGVDIIVTYNPQLLAVEDQLSDDGVQIMPGSLMSVVPYNRAENGMIKFSQVTGSGDAYSGSGALATITFRALASGTAVVGIQHTPGATTDSNVAARGADILTTATGGTYIVGSSTGMNIVVIVVLLVVVLAAGYVYYHMISKKKLSAPPA